MSAIKTDILEAMKEQLETLTWAKTVTWKKIYVTVDDLNATMVPFVQLLVGDTIFTHEKGRLLSTLTVTIEIVSKQKADQAIDQEDLFLYMQEIIQKIGEKPNLGLSSIIHCRVLSDLTDFHMLEPYYYGSVTFEVIHYLRYTNCN